MDYLSYEAFHQGLIDYLNQEIKLYEADIEARKSLSDDEKEIKGLIIRNAKISPGESSDKQIIKFDVTVNNTKLRPGDKVLLTSDRTNRSYDGTVIENTFESVYVSCSATLPSDDVTYTIGVNESVLIGTILELMQQIEEGYPGAYFIKELAGLEDPELTGFDALSEDKIVRGPQSLNKEQEAICKTIIKRPSIYCIQGPPGTGKTDVVSTLAETFSNQNKDVLIVSNTHQAVNNALNKIIKKNSLLPVTKIGEELKAMELDDNIILAKNYKEFSSVRKGKKKSTQGDIVGMTFYGAAINLGLRRASFRPSLILVDEAGQMPFVEGATVGAFGSGSIVFIGDDKQMPPIFHESLVQHPFSTSIFAYICDKYPALKASLRVTYRMNDEITDVVSRNYYEPYGEKIIPSNFSKNRRLILDCSCEDKRIERILTSAQSLHRLNVTTNTECEDENIEEASFISGLIHQSYLAGVKAKDIAVITPFRKQARVVRECVLEKDVDDIPLIDTVERLQGQDVDVIIISFCVSSESYFRSLSSFLLNKNRLNVMISRAKKKVIILASSVFEGFLPI
jgi:Superfamily I DNA and RNA helicases and helicase subunits